MLDWCVPASVSVAGLLRHPVDPRRHLVVPDMCARGQTQLHAVSQGGRSHEKHKVPLDFCVLRSVLFMLYPPRPSPPPLMIMFCMLRLKVAGAMKRTWFSMTSLLLRLVSHVVFLEHPILFMLEVPQNPLPQSSRHSKSNCYT